MWGKGIRERMWVEESNQTSTVGASSMRHNTTTTTATTPTTIATTPLPAPQDTLAITHDSTAPMLTAAAYLPNGYGGDFRLKVLEATILQPKEAPLRSQQRNNQHSYGGFPRERQWNNRKNDEDNSDGDSSAHQ
jgi:hypothetical protein